MVKPRIKEIIGKDGKVEKRIDTANAIELPGPPKHDPKDLIDEEAEGYKFTVTPEMQAYIDMKKAAGVATVIEDEKQEHAFVKEFNSWVKAGRPRPKLPELKIEEDPIPQKFYRTRYMGKQKFFWRDTAGKLHGKTIESKPIYKKEVDSDGKEYNELQKYVQIVKYPIDFNADLVKKLIADAMDRCSNPTFYFIVEDGRGGTKAKYSVVAEDFVGDFDEIIKLHLKKDYMPALRTRSTPAS